MTTIAGRVKFADALLDYLGTLFLVIFTNDTPVTESTIYDDLEQPTWPGYEPAPVGAWSPATYVGPHARTIAVDQVVWSNTGGSAVEIFGWGLADMAGQPILVAGERFATTPTLAAGHSISLRPFVDIFHHI